MLACDVETALEVVVAELSPPQRVALILHDVFGFTFTEIGGILGTSEQAASRESLRVGRANHFGMEDGHQTIEIAPLGRGEKRGDHLPCR